MSVGLFKHATNTVVLDGGNLLSVDPGGGTPADYCRAASATSSVHTTAVAGLTWALQSGTWSTRFPGPKQYTKQSPNTYCVVLPDVTTLNAHGGSGAGAAQTVADEMYAQRNNTGCTYAIWCSIPLPSSYTGEAAQMAVWLSSFLQAYQGAFGLYVLDLYNLVPSNATYWSGENLTAAGAQAVGEVIAEALIT